MGNYFSPVRIRYRKLNAEVQLVIDSCCLVGQSEYLNHSNKNCDWLVFTREQLHNGKREFGLKTLTECVEK